VRLFRAIHVYVLIFKIILKKEKKKKRKNKGFLFLVFILGQFHTIHDASSISVHS